ncbi:MAG: methylenetetrahydrofolate reductase [NAD(P)H] [Elusimicrobiales bacterium]
MDISSLFGGGGRTFSFEFYPPKTAADTASLYKALEELKPLSPDFVSVTSSPNSPARLQTAALALLIRERFGFEPMVHLTCVIYTREEVEAITALLAAEGINNILALRGDLPPGFKPSSEYGSAAELVSHIKTLGGFHAAVAAYPEVHPRAENSAADIASLKCKLDAGASFAITQLFFDNSSYFSFVEKCRAAGITAPIIPGIMPVTGHSQLKKFTSLCGIKIPPDMAADLDRLGEDRAAICDYGVNRAIAQCEELLRGGAPGIHFYTLNKSASTRRILERLRRQYPAPRS